MSERQYLRRFTVIAEFDNQEMFDWARPEIQIVDYGSKEVRFVGGAASTIDFAVKNPNYDWGHGSNCADEAAWVFNGKTHLQKIATDMAMVERRARVDEQKASGKVAVRRAEGK